MARRLRTVFGLLLLGLLASIQWTNLRLIAGLALAPSLLTSFTAQAISLQHQASVGGAVASIVPFSIEQQFVATLALQDAARNPQPELITIAQERIDGMPKNTERLAAQACLEALKGNLEVALEQGIQADASTVVETTLDILEAKGQLGLAQTWDRRYIANLQQRSTDRVSLAAALWRLARLENRAAESASSKGQQLKHRRQALEILRRELLLTPFSGRVLLTAGYAALAMNAPGEAERDFMLAVQADPASASGYIGLARVALFLHHFHDVQDDLTKALTLAPQQEDVLKLQAEVERYHDRH